MIEPPILCFSSIDWDYVWQGHQEVMTRLAAKGHPVLFVENTGLRRPHLDDASRLWRRAKHLATPGSSARDPVPGLQVHAPRILPFPYWGPAVALNQRILEAPLRRWLDEQVEHPVIWTYLPTPLIVSLATRLSPALLIYYCVDDLPASSELARAVMVSEAELLRTADLVFVTSQGLAQKALRYRRDVHVFPSGVDYDRFAAVRTSGRPVPEEIRGLQRPVVGYVGSLHRWFDVSLAAAVARLLPHVQFVFIGPVQVPAEPLLSLPNVHAIGARPHAQIPDYLRDLDAAIIPYVLDKYTKSVFPTKLNEYLAMGLPVVATPLPEIVSYRDRHGSVVEIADGAEAFASAVARALADAPSAAARDARYEVARSQSWEILVDGMRTLMESALRAKAHRGVP